MYFSRLHQVTVLFLSEGGLNLHCRRFLRQIRTRYRGSVAVAFRDTTYLPTADKAQYMFETAKGYARRLRIEGVNTGSSRSLVESLLFNRIPSNVGEALAFATATG